MSTVRVADSAFPVTTLGPGRRFVLWTQGCGFRCAGCTSPDWLSTEGGVDIPVSELAASFLDCVPHRLHGLTLSGGEPLLQAEPLLELWTAIRRARPEQTLVLFTGFTVEEIDASPVVAARELAGAADLLISGRYERDLDDGQGLRGSSNQRLDIPRSEWEGLRTRFERATRRIQLLLRADHALFAGVPPTDFRDRLLGRGAFRDSFVGAVR